MTEIVGGPDIYVDRLSTLQLTCRLWCDYGGHIGGGDAGNYVGDDGDGGGDFEVDYLGEGQPESFSSTKNLAGLPQGRTHPPLSSGRKRTR